MGSASGSRERVLYRSSGSSGGAPGQWTGDTPMWVTLGFSRWERDPVGRAIPGYLRARRGFGWA